MSSPDPFPSDALDANRAGQLTDAQRRYYLAVAKSLRKSARGTVGIMVTAIAIAVIALTRVVRAEPGMSAALPALMAIAFVVVAVLVIARTLTTDNTGKAMGRDLERVQVESIEGAIGKRTGRNSGGNTGRRPLFVDVGDQTFRVPRDVYDAAPEAGFVRVYFLPQSRRLVNLERLPDRPLSMPTTPKDLAQVLRAAASPPGRAAVNEMRAGMAGLQAAFEHPPAAPPPEQRDSRPLDQAILGAWSNELMTVVFSPGGAVTATMFGGRERRGHWSVDASGRLHSDATGRQVAADAWVAGDQLTIAAEGAGLTFTRQR